MTTYTIILSSAEDKALSFVAFSQDDWIQNVVHDRCRIAIENIVALTVQKCLETETQIPGSKEAIVELAFERGWAESVESAESKRAALNA